MDLRVFLDAWLPDGARLAVIGAGSVLKSDDGAGTILTEMLQEHFAGRDRNRVLFCAGETAPENFTGKIIAFRPTHILMLDACDVGIAPGELQDIAPERVGGPMFLTHMLPLKVMINYLIGETGAAAKLVGIQYETIRFDGKISQAVRRAMDAAFLVLKDLIEEKFL